MTMNANEMREKIVRVERALAQCSDALVRKNLRQYIAYLNRRLKDETRANARHHVTRGLTSPTLRNAKMPIERYINGIRNAEKRRYALEYWGFKRGVMNEPNPDHFKLGVMARQAVRMRMNEIMGW